MSVRINKGDPYWTQIDYAKVEDVKKAIWVADLPVRTRKGQWSEEPVAVFWQAEPPEGMNHYFGLYVQRDLMGKGGKNHLLICDATSAVEGEIAGTMSEDGEVIFSRYLHDYRESKDGTAMTDGGRDYHRFRGKPVRLCVQGPDLVLVDEVAASE
jgi:hypothetical protein